MEGPPSTEQPQTPDHDLEPGIEPTPEPQPEKQNVFEGRLKDILSQERGRQRDSAELDGMPEEEMDKRHEIKDSDSADEHSHQSTNDSRRETQTSTQPSPVSKVIEDRVKNTPSSPKVDYAGQPAVSSPSGSSGATYKKAIATGFKVALVLFVVILLWRLLG